MENGKQVGGLLSCPHYLYIPIAQLKARKLEILSTQVILK